MQRESNSIPSAGLNIAFKSCFQAEFVQLLRRMLLGFTKPNSGCQESSCASVFDDTRKSADAPPVARPARSQML